MANRRCRLANGPAKLTVTASRQVFFGLRTVESSVTRDLQVRLDPPRVAVTSIHHFINLGGAEFVVLRATPEDVDAGVKVGDVEYRAYPGSAVGIADPALRVASSRSSTTRTSTSACRHSPGTRPATR